MGQTANMPSQYHVDLLPQMESTLAAKGGLVKR